MAAFSAFQSNAFQRNAFQIVGNPSTVDKHDGFTPDEIKKYRKKLERLAKSSEKFLQSKYINEAIEVTEIAKKADIKLENIEKIALREAFTPSNEDIQKELNRILQRIFEIEIIKNQMLLEEAYDDEIMLMLLQ